MRIGVCGSQCIGKTTFIKDFLKTWNMYKTPKGTYRDLAKKKKIKINKEGDRNSQLAILNYHIDTVQKYSTKDNIIFDRCVLDPLIYSLWLYEKQIGNIKDEDIEFQLKLVKESLKLYDVIFYIPLTNSPPLMEKDDLRNTDEEYRKEIDNIFAAAQKSYHKQTNVIFPVEDSPPIIDIFGSREERIAMAKLYVTESGDHFDETDSLISGIELDGN